MAIVPGILYLGISIQSQEEALLVLDVDGMGEVAEDGDTGIMPLVYQEGRGLKWAILPGVLEDILVPSILTLQNNSTAGGRNAGNTGTGYAGGD